MNRHLLFGFCLLLLLAGSGCAKGALWRLGYLSPQARKQWADEEKIAKTWPAMRDEMTALAEQAKASSLADQQRLAKRFAKRARMNRILEAYEGDNEFSRSRLIDEDASMQIELKSMKVILLHSIL
jgi:hypothetical protein